MLRGGSQAETNSVITRDQVPLVSSLPGIAQGSDGRALLSPELSQVISLPSASDGSDVNAQLRGVGPKAWEIRPQVQLVEGRRFEPGLRELIVGDGAHQQFSGLDVGNTITIGNQTWTVVGRFESGDSHESELWADAEIVASTYNRPAYQSITARLAGGGMQAVIAAAAEQHGRAEEFILQAIEKGKGFGHFHRLGLALAEHPATGRMTKDGRAVIGRPPENVQALL